MKLHYRVKGDAIQRNLEFSIPSRFKVFAASLGFLRVVNYGKQASSERAGVGKLELFVLGGLSLSKQRNAA